MNTRSSTPPGRRFLGLERNVVAAGVVSFFMDVSSEMVYPLVPLFLASVLGVSSSLIGLIEGVAETTASLLKVGSGWLSDRLGRRKILMGAGYGVSGLSRPVLALAGSWGQVMAARFVDRFGKGVRTAPRDAIVADSTEIAGLGRSFGFHRAMDQSGAVLGPGIAFLVLAWRPEDYRMVFWLSLIPAAVAVTVIVLFIEEKRRPRVPGMAARQTPETGSAAGRRKRVGGLRGPLLSYVLITGLFALGNSSDAFLILRAENLGVTAALIPVLYLVFNLVYSGLAAPAGVLADRIGRRRMVVIGYLVFAITYAGMALAGSAAAVWGLFMLYGVYMGLSDGTGRALLAQLAPGDKRATAFGVYHSVAGLAALPASVIAGLLWDRVSPAAPFWLGAAAALLAALLLVTLVPEGSRERFRRG
ncbi:MAG: MFS transporter [Thermoleophilia bacterium]|nr:MFS transporter [Thermoleophilia bacterium]